MDFKLFFGHEDQAEAGTTAFLRSVIAHASKPISITPITRLAMPDQPEGTNSFTLRRFLVPWMLGYRGTALFVDGADMICRTDICSILEHFDYYSAVQVVHHDYKTKHARKYIGTTMEADNKDYPLKNAASVMLINCANFAWRRITPDYVRSANALDMLQLKFLPQDRIGTLPVEWNWLVDEFGENEEAKILHWTAGIPFFKAHSQAPMAKEWTASLKHAMKCKAQ